MLVIKIYDQVPQVYSNASRDFQYISWLYNIVLNYVKHNVDGLRKLPSDVTDPRITELLALTLGFKIKRKYDQKQLAALVSILPSILKCKGTKKALDLTGNALLMASGVVGEFSSTIQGASLEAFLPAELVDATLFMDLLPYILPAGMTCRVTRKTKVTAGRITELYYDDKISASWHYDRDLAVLFDADANNAKAGPSYSNSVPVLDAAGNPVTNVDETTRLNAGLLDNSVMPILGTDTHA